MIEAAYVVLAYIQDRVNDIITPDTIVMYPGRFAAETADISSGTYNVRLGVNFGQPYINTDALTVTIYHQDFDILQRMMAMLLRTLNPERAQDNPTLYAAGLSEDIKFHMIAAVVGKQDNSAFIEGTEYYASTVDILLEYVRLSGPDLESDQAMYIEGTV